MDTLSMFYQSEHSLSFKELERGMKGYDRVTIYRTLNSFLNKGVIHRIPNDSGIANYGLCDDTCEPGAHHHNHVHFKCEVCGHIDCLPEKSVPNIELPGYVIKEFNLIINGTCRHCNKKERASR